MGIEANSSKRVRKTGQYDSKDFKIIKSSYDDWENVLGRPGNINIETMHAGNVSGTAYSIINIKRKGALKVENKKLRPPLLAHLIHHEKFGEFLVDTGFDEAYSEKPWGHIQGWLKRGCKFSVEKGRGIKELLDHRKVRLNGVFCTHFHEHQGGAPSLPHDIPFVFGKGEKDFDYYPFMYARFLKDKSDTQTIDFDQADEMPIVGKAVDVFGDGSFWAISTPGHTDGHISFLVNGVGGQYMIMGDICMCQKGFELGIESGSMYAKNPVKNKESFMKIKKFLETYPQVKPIFGHESEEFPITYE